MAKIKTKTPRESTFITRKIAKSDQLNPNGTLFGGVIMAWIDEVAFMSARRYAGVPFVVTVSIDNISFLMPLRAGEHIVLTSGVNYVGRTSMEIGVKVERENQYTGERQQATSAYLTFVALDKKGRPTSVPQLTLETDEDRRRYEEARIRVRVRERVRRRMAQKLAQINSMRPTIQHPPLAQTSSILSKLSRLTQKTSEHQKRLKSSVKLFFLRYFRSADDISDVSQNKSLQKMA